MLFDMQEAKNQKRILYAGCGAGRAAINMAQDESGRCIVMGIDNSQELIELARHNKERCSLQNIEFMQSGLASYADSGDAFDLIIIGCGEMLPFHRKPLFEVAHKLLKDGGCVRGRDYSYMERLPKGRKIKAPYWMDMMDASGYVSMIQDIGYSDVTIDALESFEASTSIVPTKVNLSVDYPLRDVLITAYK